MVRRGGRPGLRRRPRVRPVRRRTCFARFDSTPILNSGCRLSGACTTTAFPAKDLSGLRLEEIRGREGVRVRESYARASRETNVEWKGRDYKSANWRAADPINRALSAGNSCLYGLCHAAIVASGYSPSPGIRPHGKALSFVYERGRPLQSSHCKSRRFPGRGGGGRRRRTRMRPRPEGPDSSNAVFSRGSFRTWRS